MGNHCTTHHGLQVATPEEKQKLLEQEAGKLEQPLQSTPTDFVDPMAPHDHTIVVYSANEQLASKFNSIIGEEFKKNQHVQHFNATPALGQTASDKQFKLHFAASFGGRQESVPLRDFFLGKFSTLVIVLDSTSNLDQLKADTTHFLEEHVPLDGTGNMTVLLYIAMTEQPSNDQPFVQGVTQELVASVVEKNFSQVEVMAGDLLQMDQDIIQFSSVLKK